MIRIQDASTEGEIEDSRWQSILDSENVRQARKNADNEMKRFDDETIRHLRHRAKTDLYFLSTGILGYNKLTPNLHGHLCSWHERNKIARFREILLPRGHYKSTIETLADSIQIVLPDDKGEEPHPRNLGTDARVLICHETDGQASNFLFAITAQFLSNPLLMGLFPECVPSRSKHRINRHELELPRSATWPEPTIDTMGVGGRSQGRHYNYMKFDDLIGDKARDSETMMEAAKQWFDNIQPFFSDFGLDHFDLIGTRWSLDDLYEHIHQRYGSQLLKYIRGAEELNEDGNLVPIFPEGGFNSDSLAILKLNPKVYNAQYANNPTAGATEFKKEWKRYYGWTVPNRQLTIRHQWASGQITSEKINVSDLDICILYDPAMSGYAGIVVTGTDDKKRCFILEALKECWRPPEACDLIFRLVAKWQPRLVAIEEVLFSGIYQNWFAAEMQLRNTYFNIVPVKPEKGGQKQSKEMRVRGLTNYFSAGLIYFGLDQTNLVWEFDNFGATRNYHMLDSLAYGPDVWMPGMRREIMDKYKQAEALILKERDSETGYSTID